MFGAFPLCNSIARCVSSMVDCRAIGLLACLADGVWGFVRSKALVGVGSLLR